ncbi:hypothetical protein AMS68_007912 [Peltaster fructicola]|uniref:Methyltransferase domain-containing protein n=1 Tax=Peltaster fructicola TaxID=286661 RepID=A0A6H0Y668_9PEZI|nr:hypothetical protein AMS68_007912 [Peltaster fructicola]
MENKEIVRKGYNVIAEKYLAWFQGRPMLHEEKLNQVLEHLNSQSRVLELGCGAGTPITKRLTERVAEVVANDYSEKQIELAKQNAPKAKLIHGDMAQLEFEPESFDAIVAFYSFFHLPKEAHQPLLKKIHSWLKKDGLLMYTHSVEDKEYNSSFLGVDTFFGSFGVDGNVKLAEDSGFEIIQAEVRAQGDVADPDDPDNGVSFLWIFAKKKSA